MQVTHEAHKIIQLPAAYNKTNNGRIPAQSILLFLVWPLGVLIQAIKNFRQPWAKNLFWLFCIYFGLSFVVGDQTSRSNDAQRYTEQLQYFHSGSIDINKLFNQIYSEGGYVDIYQPLVTWLLGIFTDKPQWLFALFALVFGYFYSRNIWILLDFYKINRWSLIASGMLLAFALSNPIWNINGVRMWTAAQIFIYGLFLYFLKNQKRKGILWIACTPLFHFSFLFPLGLFFIYLILPKSIIVFFIVFLLTSFIKELNLEFVQDRLSILPEVFQPRVRGYTNLEYAESIKENIEMLHWHVKLAQYSLSIVVYSFVFILFISLNKNNNSHSILRRLFLFGLFMGSWANISAHIPSGGRFLVLSNSILFACFFLFMASQYRKNAFVHLKNFISIPLAFWIIFSIRIGLDYSGILTLFGNPIITSLVSESTPIIDYIKKLL
ncbi:MAG: EpsG family protein [Thermaurantimonas sp.]